MRGTLLLRPVEAGPDRTLCVPELNAMRGTLLLRPVEAGPYALRGTLPSRPVVACPNRAIQIPAQSFRPSFRPTESDECEFCA